MTTEETVKEIILGKLTISTKKEQLSNTCKALRRTLAKNGFAIFILTTKTRVPTFAHMSLFHYVENISTTVIFLRRYIIRKKSLQLLSITHWLFGLFRQVSSLYKRYTACFVLFLALFLLFFLRYTTYFTLVDRIFYCLFCTSYRLMFRVSPPPFRADDKGSSFFFVTSRRKKQ